MEFTKFLNILSFEEPSDIEQVIFSFCNSLKETC